MGSALNTVHRGPVVSDNSLLPSRWFYPRQENAACELQWSAPWFTRCGHEPAFIQTSWRRLSSDLLFALSSVGLWLKIAWCEGTTQTREDGIQWASTKTTEEEDEDWRASATSAIYLGTSSSLNLLVRLRAPFWCPPQFEWSSWGIEQLIVVPSVLMSSCSKQALLVQK